MKSPAENPWRIYYRQMVNGQQVTRCLGHYPTGDAAATASETYYPGLDLALVVEKGNRCLGGHIPYTIRREKD